MTSMDNCPWCGRALEHFEITNYDGDKVMSREWCDHCTASFRGDELAREHKRQAGIL